MQLLILYLVSATAGPGLVRRGVYCLVTAYGSDHCADGEQYSQHWWVVGPAQQCNTVFIFMTIHCGEFAIAQSRN